ncbi:MAG: NAD(P)-dependent oxidoreductase [Burkholderiaceae bacterium]
MRLGFVGTGVMGAPMVGHLVAGGHDVTVYDSSDRAQARLLERVPAARVASSLRELAAESEVVFTMLPNGRVVRSCVEGENGLAAGLQPGSLLIDTSSSEPPLTRETASVLAARGGRMLDAPVSGAVEGAEAADLVFMVGGHEDDLARARPLLELLGRTIIHLGPLGAGHLMKTVNNLATALTLAGTIEAMSIGKAGGLDPTRMLEVLNVSTGGSFVSRHKIGQHIVPGSFEDPFKLALMFKDVSIARDEARALGLSLPVTDLGHDLYRRATDALDAGASVMELARWYAGLTGVRLWPDDGAVDTRAASDA